MGEVKTTIGGLEAPVFYPSISSASKNIWSVLDHIELLVSANHPQFLISCFDVYKLKNNQRFNAALERAREQYQVVLWDSGIYEVVWSRSKKWCNKRYIKTLRGNDFNHALGFDEYCLSGNEVSPEIIINSHNSSVHQVAKNKISPIIHCRDLNNYPSYCCEVSKACAPKMIAIPERELGRGVLEISKNIKAIRSELNNLDRYQVLHILGTGNPISMMLYAFAGADSFDGLDWCQTVVDYETGSLHHPLQLDLYEHQSTWSLDKDMSFFARCYMHNLEFYKNWIIDLQNAIKSGDELDMMQRYLSNSFIDNYSEKVFYEDKNGSINYGAMAN